MKTMDKILEQVEYIHNHIEKLSNMGIFVTKRFDNVDEADLKKFAKQENLELRKTIVLNEVAYYVSWSVANNFVVQFWTK